LIPHQLSGSREVAVNALLDSIGEHGYRVTMSRRAALHALIVSERALTADAIWKQAQQYHPSLGRATVYRTLEILEALGLVQRLHDRRGCHLYILNFEASQSIFVCETCGGFAYIPVEPLEDLLCSIASRNDFHLMKYVLQLSGICATCDKG
jgi:Fur family transcriptional regulator, ferric uptake regulator